MAIKEKLLKAITQAKELYHRLVLVTGHSCNGKTALLNDLAQELGQQVIPINLELSRNLLEMTNKKRLLKTPEILGEILGSHKEIVILDSLEILFDVSLKQDPLALLKKNSRNKTIVASWSGTLDHGKLVYAEPGHPEYRTYDPTDIQIVRMENDH